MKRAAFAAIVLLLVLGTVFTAHAIYDQIATGTWGPAGNLVESRSNAAAARLDDGRVLFTGGTGANGALNSAELLTAGAGFAPVAPMTEARSKHTATKLSDAHEAAARASGEARTHRPFVVRQRSDTQARDPSKFEEREAPPAAEKKADQV